MQKDDKTPQYKLDIGERLTLLNCLPKEGDFVTQTIVKALISELDINIDEIEKINLRSEGDNLLWDNKKAKVKAIAIKPKAHTVIVEALKLLDTEKKLTQNHLSLYEKFVVED